VSSGVLVVFAALAILTVPGASAAGTTHAKSSVG
jgi:hypothetical protein